MACKNRNMPDSSVEDFYRFHEKAKQMNLKADNFEAVTSFIEMSGAEFMPAIVNNPLNPERYMNNIVIAAANMGVYMADGLYQFAYNRNKDGYLSISAAKSIAINLEIEKAFDDLVFNRYNDSIIYADSIIATMGQCIAESKYMLNSQDRMQVFTGIIGGNYIEKLFILFHIIFEFDAGLRDESKLLALQRVFLTADIFLKKLPDVIALIESVRRETDPGSILAQLKEIEILHIQLKFEEDPANLTPAMILENEIMQKIHEKIIDVRTLIVALP
jgi:hypothetical protein